MSAPRAILHVDMDAFYAAVEQRDFPELRGRPVVVGQLGPRSVVSTCSYEARPYGVRSAMPTLVAQRLCPQAVFVAPRMQRYREVSQDVFGVFAEFTPDIEGLSLDEAFLDVSASRRLFGSLEAMGRRIKEEVRRRTGLTASIGMAHNKLLAKLASELGKPDGLLHIRPEQVQAVLDPLPVARLWTVGKVAEAALHRLGIHTVGELRLTEPRRLAQALGNHAALLQQLARGEDERPVLAEVAERSISAESTFAADLARLPEAEAWVASFAERVGERVRAQGLKGATVWVKLRTPPFQTHTRQQRLTARSDSTEDITVAARQLLRSWWEAQVRPRLRLLGVGMSGFGEETQPDLFADPRRQRRDALADAVNRRYGLGSLTRGRVLATRKSNE